MCLTGTVDPVGCNLFWKGLKEDRTYLGMSLRTCHYFIALNGLSVYHKSLSMRIIPFFQYIFSSACLTEGWMRSF